MWLKGISSAALAFIALPATAWDYCSENAERRAEVDSAGVERVEIIAGAGDLDVLGKTGATTVLAHGRACARDEEDLTAIDLRIEREGTTVRLIAEIPRNVDNASLDFRVEVPDGVALDVVDSSGDASVKQVAALELRDSSGDIRVEDVTGNVTAEDSSGDLELADVGDVHVVSDSSGEIHITRARAVRIDVDSSGDIVVRDVAGSVSIGDDSSGSIEVSDVRGDFTVENDGSGDIDYTRIGGQVRLPIGD